MTDILAEYRRTAEEVQDSLTVAKGITTALYELAREFPGVANNDPTASAIMVLIRLSDEKVQELIERHDEEWRAVFDAHSRTAARKEAA